MARHCAISPAGNQSIASTAVPTARTPPAFRMDPTAVSGAHAPLLQNHAHSVFVSVSALPVSKLVCLCLSHSISHFVDVSVRLSASVSFWLSIALVEKPEEDISVCLPFCLSGRMSRSATPSAAFLHMSLCICSRSFVSFSWHAV